MITNRLTQLSPTLWQIKAHAKLNLGLRVFPPRPDGFHDIESWFVPISWHDTLTVDTAPDIQNLSLTITGRSEGVPTDPHKNLAGKAALALAAHANLPPRAHISLHKILPHGGGIGGGSADAACTLLALNAAWSLHLPIEQLESIAASIGSDVPFFLHHRPTLCTGRGEIMTSLPTPHTLFALLLIPPMGCPTKDVYQTFDALGAEAEKSKIPWQQWAAAPADYLNSLLINDLQAAAFRVAPKLAEIHARAQSLAGQPIHMTGSGSTLFTLAPSSQKTEHLQSLLTPHFADCTLIPVRVLS